MKTYHTIIPAFLGLALISCENPADKTADATTTEAVETTTANGVGTEYVISSDSAVGFVGSKVTGSHEGGFKGVSGKFMVNEDDEVTGGTVLIDMQTTWSDSEKLTGHLKAEDFFHVDEYPKAAFTVTGVEKSENGFNISGNLDLRGVEKNITFPATAEKDGDMIKVKALFDINRKDWGIVYAGKTDDLIRDEVVIKFDLVAAPEA